MGAFNAREERILMVEMVPCAKSVLQVGTACHPLMPWNVFSAQLVSGVTLLVLKVMRHARIVLLVNTATRQVLSNKIPAEVAHMERTMM
jgi:hypothetical protein